MGACHGLRAAFTVGSVLMILLVVYWDQVGVGFNPFTLYPLQDPKRDSVPDPFGSSHPLPQATRKRRIFDVCTAMGEESVNFPGKSRTFGQIPYRELDHLIVDDTHRIIYCNVPKIASTNWKRIMVVLAGSTNYTDPGSVPHLEAHDSNLLQTFADLGNGNQSRNLMELKLQNYTKFLFVRDPLVRLISAFRSKFERPIQYFYKNYGSVILRRYANLSGSLPAGVAEAFAAGIIPTFQQFIKYLLDPQTEKEEPFNEHWIQVHRLCHPCQIQYDFIGRMETLETDSEQLLKLLGLNHRFHFPSGQRNRTDTSWLSDWFTQIPVVMRKELYKLYEPDFELFGYPKPDSVLHLQ